MEFLDGNQEDLSEGAEENITDQKGRRFERRLIDTIIDSISKTVDEGDHEVHQAVVKCIITIISTFRCQVHDTTLLQAL